MPYKVLVVDDEAPVRDLFKEVLTKEKYSVITASTGKEALDIVGAQDLDVVLLDIKLSDISGMEVLKMIKDQKPDVAVILITGFGYDEKLIHQCMEYGCSGYIGKNMPLSQIISNFKLFADTAKKGKK